MTQKWLWRFQYVFLWFSYDFPMNLERAAQRSWLPRRIPHDTRHCPFRKNAYRDWRVYGSGEVLQRSSADIEKVFGREDADEMDGAMDKAGRESIEIVFYYCARLLVVSLGIFFFSKGDAHVIRHAARTPRSPPHITWRDPRIFQTFKNGPTWLLERSQIA